MLSEWIAVGVAAAALVAAAAMWLLVRPWMARRRHAANDRARHDFHLQRERLECVFFRAAAESGCIAAARRKNGSAASGALSVVASRP